MFDRWFHDHQWYPVGVYHYRDTSYSKPGALSTSVTSRCLTCGELKVEHLFGSGLLDLKQLQQQTQESLQLVQAKSKPRSLPNWLKIIK